jgi:hypothetical protein
MPTNSPKTSKFGKRRFSEQGLTYMESIVAAATFTISMMTLGTAFVGQRMTTLNAAMTTGASVAAQQVTDKLRQTNPTDMPTSGTVVVNNATTSPLSVMGYSYGTEVTYCPTGHVVCNSSTRQVRIKVNFNGKSIYAVDTVFTDFKGASEG